MEELFEVKRSNKALLEKIISEDPYSDLSFAKNGYTLKDGSSIGKEDIYLYIKGDPAYVEEAKKRLKDIANIPENKEELIKKIKEEENKAQEGFGNLFG